MAKKPARIATLDTAVIDFFAALKRPVDEVTANGIALGYFLAPASKLVRPVKPTIPAVVASQATEKARAGFGGHGRHAKNGR